MTGFLAYLYWDPSRFIFNVPILDRPLGWYGLLFAFGFIVGYFVMVRVFKRELLYACAFTPAHVANWPELRARLKKAAADSSAPLHKVAKKLGAQASDDDICHALGQAFDHGALEAMLPGIVRPIGDLAYYLTDRLCWLVVAGTVLGARLGHVFFYDWAYYSSHLSEIPKVWEGGLASHGGVVGIVIALVFFTRLARKILPVSNLILSLDLLAVGCLFACFCIRLGNFFNQEIVGTVTDVPWAVIFGHPAEGGAALPRHPVQLYEGFFYLGLFFVLYYVWDKGYHHQRPGLIIGLLFSLVFTWRILMEFFKEDQGGLLEGSWLQTGQILSIPLVLIGLWLIFRRKPVATKLLQFNIR